MNIFFFKKKIHITWKKTFLSTKLDKKDKKKQVKSP